MNVLGQMLADWRYMRKLSKSEAAKIIGVTEHQYRAIETSKVHDPKVLLFLIQRLFGELSNGIGADQRAVESLGTEGSAVVADPEVGA